ncbi:hypothetical protein MKY04_09325 [Lysinibacillus telephonicus]|uniref:hypothetical protein n=1 Tax=Lysinibacillus telephonicus TaxID=1714840 RepID=UPI0031FC12BA
MAIKNKQIEETIQGKKFIFQHPGLEEALDMRERAKNDKGVLSDKALYKEILNHAVFVEEEGSPCKVDFEYFEQFDSLEVFSEVMKKASTFIFR